MAGIYIHIPFCKTRCSYCDFYSSTQEEWMDRYVNAVCRELIHRKNELPDATIETIYFGGGTPSQLALSDFEQIFDTIHTHYRVIPNAEITLEANPDDLSIEYIGGLARLPFNRISIGIQSFIDRELQMLNRRHSAQQAIDAVNACNRLGFNNISIDLMYGLPGQTLADWEYNLDQAFNLPVQHISAYHLTYEKGTKLFFLLQSNKIKETDENLSLAMFALLRIKVKEHQFIPYEISNFSREGYISRHNSSYWKGIPYLGIGASAHSYDGKNRAWNPLDLKHYIKEAESGNFNPETEASTPQSRYNDLIITSLRTSWGLNLIELKARFGDEFLNFCLKEAQTFLEKGWLIHTGDQLIISESGLFMSDAIMSELLSVD